jgi:hypothetical protein
MLASSKMPCFNCIICTGAPYRRPTSVARSSPKTAALSIRRANMRRTGLPDPSSRRCGANRSRSGSLLA